MLKSKEMNTSKNGFNKINEVFIVKCSILQPQGRLGGDSECMATSEACPTYALN